MTLGVQWSENFYNLSLKFTFAIHFTPVDYHRREVVIVVAEWIRHTVAYVRLFCLISVQGVA